MSNWSAGYVSDIDYTHGYYAELNPARIRMAFLNNGLVFPEVGTACELGFGQGMSAALHAAASVCEWHGNDFNPSQAGFAQEIVAASGARAALTDESFQEFCLREDLPDFDFISLHGIWSWISDENRRLIVDFVRRRLKVGGVLYISYNTLPGWANFAPMRFLMTKHAELMGAPGSGIVSRIDSAVGFAEQLLETKPKHVRASPEIQERMSKIKAQDRQYLAHEYFNQDWHPMYFSTMQEWLGPAKMSYACSAHYLDHIDGINLSAEQQEFIKAIPDPELRESVRDFMVNQQFRRDYWVKGPRRLTALEKSEMISAQRFLLSSHRPDIPMKVSGALGEAVMSEQIYTPLLDLMADHRIRTLGEIRDQLRPTGVEFAMLIQAMMVLVGMGHMQLVAEETVIAKAKKTAEKVNNHLIHKSRSRTEISFLASPVIGGGYPVSRFAQLFVLALQQGRKQPRELAEYVWELMAVQGQKVVKEGQAMTDAEENIAELQKAAEDFQKKTLPILKALQIV